MLMTLTVSSDMKLQPNVGSDRSWVWKVAADYSEDPPTSETLAIRFANSDRAFPTNTVPILSSLNPFSVADDFKKAFESAQTSNIELSSKVAPPKESEPAPVETKEEEKEEETKEEAKEETKEETKAE
jgi:Ran-binding protein 1